jgi:hypothetical protein
VEQACPAGLRSVGRWEATPTSLIPRGRGSLIPRGRGLLVPQGRGSAQAWGSAAQSAGLRAVGT